jgi:hypothetical protein
MNEIPELVLKCNEPRQKISILTNLICKPLNFNIMEVFLNFVTHPDNSF